MQQHSEFSLRPPLAACKNHDDDETNTATTTSLQASFIPASVLVRMYIACEVLRLTTETRFTALVLLHRYVRAKQQQQQPPQKDSIETITEDWPWVGATCLFLACKAEDEPRRLRDMINMAQMVLKSSSHDNNNDTTKHNDSTIVVLDLNHTPPLDGDYWDSKKKAIETEQMVLRWLGFDCFVSHPHRALHWILGQVMTDSANDVSKNKIQKRETAAFELGNGKNSMVDEIRSLASQRLNDTLFYPPALQWGVIEMACASIDLAVADIVGDSRSPASDGRKNLHEVKAIFQHGWWALYNISNKDFNNCRNSLMQATGYLKTMAPTEK